ncbi:hypothetical protein [Bacillus horti]|uniref:Uncharacterized protein n=1 Tax=Caldalkalibacillus horti TaxID=77523 RepID=A0ABT9W259_9BACI|nr:hypothetical protein [Bacillus horti]MDQ0167326.1 hypothetical protein [Bacillus horti]
MISVLLTLLLKRSSSIKFTEEEIVAYDKLLTAIGEGKLITYDLNYPKYRFLQYATSKKEYVLHGSNNPDIHEFEPRRQTLYNNEWTKAVFATTDSNWAIFYAVFNRSQLIGNFRNGCIIRGKSKFHYFSLNESTMKRDPWTDGVVYLLPKDTFTHSGQGKIQFDEWISEEPVKPVGRLAIDLNDFTYKNKVAVHKDNESMVKTWLLYKARILVGSLKKVKVDQVSS